MWYARILIPVALLLALGPGCALNRSVITLAPRQVEEKAAGKPVVITRVTDLRKFEVAPADPSTPSLMDGSITDTAVTARAVGRKRGGFGKAFGDVLLPEGQDVTGLVRETLANSLREAGYKVVAEGTPDAPGVEVDVKELWMWFSPGFWYVTLNFRSVLELKGAPVKEGAATVRTELDKGFQVVVEADWARVLGMGCDKTQAGLLERLNTP